MKKYSFEFTNEGQELNYSESKEFHSKDEAKEWGIDRVNQIQEVLSDGFIGCKVMNEKYHEIYFVEEG